MPTCANQRSIMTLRQQPLSTRRMYVSVVVFFKGPKLKAEEKEARKNSKATIQKHQQRWRKTPCRYTIFCIDIDYYLLISNQTCDTLRVEAATGLMT